MASTIRSQRLAGAAAIVMAAYVSSRLTGLLRDVAISYRFGTGPELDAYYAANRIPDLIFQVVAGAAVASAFIPVYSSYLARDAREEGWAMLSTFFTLSVVILLPIVVLAMVVAPWIVPFLVPGFQPANQSLTVSLARIVLLAPIFFTVGCFATSVLNAHGRFFLAALAPTCYNLGIILGATIFGRWLGIQGLAGGALLGSVLFLAIQLPGLREIGVVFRPALNLRHPGVREVARLMGPRAIGLAVTQVNFLVTVNLASAIPGGNSSLTYAWMLAMLPLGIFAMAISTAVFPSLAEQSAGDRQDELRQTLLQAMRFILYLTVPASIGLIVLSQPIVHLLYQRGQFTAESTAMTAGALRLYAAGLFGMATTEIVTRAFYALHDTATPVKVAAVGMVINLVLAVGLVQVLGENGLALATAVASTAEAALLLALAQRRISGLPARELIASALRSLGAALLMAAVVGALLTTAAPLGQPLGGLPLVASAVVIGTATYLAATVLFGSAEVTQLRQLLRRGIG